MYGFDTFVKNQLLALAVWVYFWVFYSISLFVFSATIMMFFLLWLCIVIWD
jgi:hypothetical protein